MKTTDSIWFTAPILLLLALTAAFGYSTSYGESDMSIIGMGLVYAANWGDRLAGGLQYGMSFSFGYYQLLYLLLSDTAMRDPLQVARTINLVGLGSALLFVLTLSLMLDRLLPQRRTALFVMVAFTFCPISLPFLASAHPFIGACAMLFLTCWLALQSIGRRLPQQLGWLAVALPCMLFALTLRGDVALAMPFVLAACWADSAGQPGRPQWRALAAVALMLALAMLAFLYLQRPFTGNTGGAGGTLGGFIKQFIALRHISKGLVLLAMAFGLLSLPVMAYTLYQGQRNGRLKQPMLLVWLVLALPSLAFWLPNPQPARHFLLPILALFGIMGTLADGWLHHARRALLLGFALAIGNQLVAELVRPLVVRSYQWSYPAEGLRRATQQTPIGLFPLDQQANRLSTERARQEAVRLAASQPQKLLVLADTYQYMATALMAADPTLRATREQVGSFEALRLNREGRDIYILIKQVNWPTDTLAEILKLREYADYRIYVQPATISRYDRTQVPVDRNFSLPPQ